MLYTWDLNNVSETLKKSIPSLNGVSSLIREWKSMECPLLTLTRCPLLGASTKKKKKASVRLQMFWKAENKSQLTGLEQPQCNLKMSKWQDANVSPQGGSESQWSVL